MAHAISALVRLTVLLIPVIASRAMADVPPASANNDSRLTLGPLHAGHVMPLVAIVGHSGGTEASQFLIPYALLVRSKAAEVVAVATTDAPVTLRPAVQVLNLKTSNTFDTQHPEGADIVIVPEAVDPGQADPALGSWLQGQARKGALVVAISDGVQSLARAGLLEHRRAIGHWGSLEERRRHWPTTQWITDRRYVQDGQVVSAAGTAAVVPLSLALVEVIAGHDKAVSLATEVGVASWAPQHDAARFARSARYLTSAWMGLLSPHETAGVEMQDGIDDVALALAMEAWSRTHRTSVAAVATKQHVTSGSGLILSPTSPAPDRIDHRVQIGDAHSAQQLARSLNEITARYGARSAELVGVEMELDLSGPSGM